MDDSCDAALNVSISECPFPEIICTFLGSGRPSNESCCLPWGHTFLHPPYFDLWRQALDLILFWGSRSAETLRSCL